MLLQSYWICLFWTYWALAKASAPQCSTLFIDLLWSCPNSCGHWNGCIFFSSYECGSILAPFQTLPKNTKKLQETVIQYEYLLRYYCLVILNHRINIRVLSFSKYHLEKKCHTLQQFLIYCFGLFHTTWIEYVVTIFD